MCLNCPLNSEVLFFQICRITQMRIYLHYIFIGKHLRSSSIPTSPSTEFIQSPSTLPCFAQNRPFDSTPFRSLRLRMYRVDTEHFASLCGNSVEVGIEVLRIGLVKDPSNDQNSKPDSPSNNTPFSLSLKFCDLIFVWIPRSSHRHFLRSQDRRNEKKGVSSRV